MKKIISLILVLVCIMSLVLSGCDEQEIEPVTVDEIFDLLKTEGYDNIQHEEDSNDYVLLDSGDSIYEDENDIVITLRTDENNGDHIIQGIDLLCDSFTEEFESLSRYILTYITKDTESVDEIILSTQIESASMKEKGKFSFFGFQSPSDDTLEEIEELNPNSRRYRIILIITHYWYQNN